MWLIRASRTGEAQELILGHSSRLGQAMARVLFSYGDPVAVEILGQTVFVPKNQDPPDFTKTSKRHLSAFLETTEGELKPVVNELLPHVARGLFISAGCWSEVQELMSAPGEATAPDAKKASPGQDQEEGAISTKDLYRIFYGGDETCED